MKKLFTIFLHIYLFTSIAIIVLDLLANNTENDSNTSMATKISENSSSTNAAENNNTNNNILDNNSANTEPSIVTTKLKISNSPITLEEDETKKTPLLLLI